MPVPSGAGRACRSLSRLWKYDSLQRCSKAMPYGSRMAAGLNGASGHETIGWLPPIGPARNSRSWSPCLRGLASWRIDDRR